MRLFRFIDWLLVLPAKLELETRRFITELEGASNMPYVTSIERLAKEEGKEEGLREGLLEAIDLGLELRFGKAALQVCPRVRDIADLSRLRELKVALTRVGSVGEFEALVGGA
jgi:hypothetical protein